MLKQLHIRKGVTMRSVADDMLWNVFYVFHWDLLSLPEGHSCL